MAVPGPSSRFLYTFDGTANLGVNLTGTAGQVGEFHPPEIDETLQELAGSAATYPTVARTGHASTPDWTMNIWADSALQSLIDDLHGVTAADRSDLRIIVTGFDTDANAKKFQGMRGYLSKIEPKTPPAALTELAVTVKPTGIAEIGDIHHALSAATADGDTKSTSIDGTASSATGGVGYFGYTVLNLDSGTGFAPRVIDSADNVTFAALVTFTTVTATTGGGQRSALATTATVRRYLASDWDFTGTPGGSATCTFFIGFMRGQGQ